MRHILLTVVGKALLTVVVLGLFVNAWGQTTPSAKPVSRDADLQDSNPLVSLSAEKIIGILRQETGLLLEVKKLLVRKAREQGRILDPEDLTDEALFRLLRDDALIRALATQEIERRNYVRAKPTRDELRANVFGDTDMGPTKTATGGNSPADQLKRASQEEAYWTSKEGAAAAAAAAASAKPGQANPEPIQRPVQPPLDPSEIRRRQRELERAEWRPAPDSPLGGEMSPGMMARVSPDQLPSLLRAGGRDSAMSDESGSDVSSSSRLTQSYELGQGSVPSLQDPMTGSSREDMLHQYREYQELLNSDIRSPQQARLETKIPYRTQPLRNLERVDNHPPLRHRANPYADIPSLYDLYAQFSRRSVKLERFGEDIFRNGTGNFDDLPMDVPAGPDYVLGPGDGLNIELYGGVSRRLQRLVDRQGRLALPEVGSIQASGRNLGEIQRAVQSVLRTQYRDVQVDVSLARLRSVRVYVVGDVAQPGAYDISSLSTPLNAVYTAGGPTQGGSLRTLRHYRGKQLVQEIDTYDLLLHGVNGNVQPLQAGDSILVPPLGSEVIVQGMVRRPAIYELRDEKQLAEVLELAGGVLPSGTLRHIEVERVQTHEKRTMLRLDIPETNDSASINRTLDDFQVQDGDSVRIAPILPYSEKTVYLDGHVFHPGKYAYHDGMRFSDLIKGYADLMPEPSQGHAEIIRLNAPDYKPTVLAFNLGDALAGKGPDLRPFDTVRIFSRYDFEDSPTITINGEVRDPGDHLTNGVTRLRDAVFLAGGVTPDAQLTDAQVFRKEGDGKLKVLNVNLEKALAGVDTENVLLQSKDRVFIQRSQAKIDPPTVTIQGEVAHPGKYPLGEGMTASELVRLSGGFKRGAFTENADLSRYLTQDGQTVGQQQIVQISKAMSGVENADTTLRDGDVLNIRQVAGWKDIGAVITVKGEVQHQGGYGIREGEKLSGILKRAGGLRDSAYPYGAILERVAVREIEERNRADLLQRVQAEGAVLNLMQPADEDQRLAKQAAVLQWQTTVDKLQNTPPAGRLVVHISSKIDEWANTPSDIEVRAGDTLTIPKKPNFVMVDGSVYNPTAVTFKSGKSAEWYLKQAGGPTQMANKKGIFVIRADGSVVSGSSGLFTGDALKAELRAGDFVVVPEKAYSGTSKWKTSLQVAQLVSAAGIAIQVARGF